MFLWVKTKKVYICSRLGEMAEWSNAVVLKTIEGHTSGGSNPSLSARKTHQSKDWWVFCFLKP